MENFKLTRNQIADHTPDELVHLYLNCQMFIGNIDPDDFDYKRTQELLMEGLDKFNEKLQETRLHHLGSHD